MLRAKKEKMVVPISIWSSFKMCIEYSSFNTNCKSFSIDKRCKLKRKK